MQGAYTRYSTLGAWMRIRCLQRRCERSNRAIQSSIVYLRCWDDAPCATASLKDTPTAPETHPNRMYEF
ncbi:uncharacterized protein SCHCODRAFT_02609289, partial [Schizophyllum commune H4-8]|uniref:uncharacterized protein n=1 Tax=Schizophyllum commune (strain H4-8 / FGSC 9210) TaxID=578458 RepID=UPI00215F32A2